MQISNIESKKVWEDFLVNCGTDTFLQSWNWGEFYKEMNYKIFRIGVFDGENLIAVALFIKIQAKRGSFLFCPHGPIAKFRISNFEFRILVDYLKKLAKKEKCSFIRISPLMKDSKENNDIFLRQGFRDAPIHLMHPERAWILDIEPSEDDLLKNMRKTTRYSIKKAQKDGVRVYKSSDAEDIEKFWSVYSRTYKRQHFTPFSKEYLHKEFEIFQKDNKALLFFAEYNNEIISSAMIVFTENSSFYHHGASVHKYQKITASYLLQMEVIREAKKRGCKKHNLWGIAPQGSKRHPWSGLTLFKTGFGGYEKKYVHAKDYILSLKYWVTFIIERIRRAKRGL